MWKNLKRTIAVGSVAAALSAVPAMAQETGAADVATEPPARATTERADTDDEGFNLGWLGLAGLLGLVGLMRKDHDHHDRDIDRAGTNVHRT